MASSVVSTNGAAAAIRSTPAEARMVAPFTRLRSRLQRRFNISATRKNADITTLASTGERVSCIKVWPTVGIKKFETLSYLPPLSREQLVEQVKFLIRLDLVPCLEFTLGEAFPYRKNARSLGYYD